MLLQIPLLGALFFGGSLVAAAQSVTYGLDLTSMNGAANGTGSLTIDKAPSSTGTSVYIPYNGTLQSLQFTIGDVTFTPSFSSATFFDAELVGLGSTSIDEAYELNTGAATNFTLALDGQDVDTGVISVTPAFDSAVTPEPSSIALLGTGMLGIAGLVRKRL